MNIICSLHNGILTKWNRSVGKLVKTGDKIAEILTDATATNPPQFTYVISSCTGIVVKLYINSGDAVSTGQSIAEIAPCAHPALFKNICVSCGQNILESAKGVAPSDDLWNVNKLSYTGGHSLRLSQDEASRIQKNKADSLRASRRLALILDLDNTLLHATSVDPRINRKDIYHFIIQESVGISSKERTFVSNYWVKLRKDVLQFLEEINRSFQLYVYTHGTRSYAREIASILDPTGVYFGNFTRVLSRNDVPDLGSQEKSLRRLFLGDLSMALILDDREDVWQGEQRQHLLQVRPYFYFTELSTQQQSTAQPTPAVELHPPPATPLETAPDGTPSSARPSIAVTPYESEASGEESETEAVEEDSQLQHSLSLLQRLHAEYYSRYDQLDPQMQQSPLSKSLSVATLLREARVGVLAGCCVVFSGVIPTNEATPNQHPLWRMAHSLGASVGTALDAGTSHLLVQDGCLTHKVTEARRRGDVWVVRKEWLQHCYWAMEKVDERSFLVAPPPSTASQRNEGDRSEGRKRKFSVEAVAGGLTDRSKLHTELGHNAAGGEGLNNGARQEYMDEESVDEGEDDDWLADIEKHVRAATDGD